MNARLFKATRVTCVIGYFLFAVAAATALASNTVYTVEGRLQCQSPFLKRTNDITFTVCVSNCVWSIRATTSELPKGATFKQVYDGDITSSYAHSPDGVQKKSSIGNDSTLGVESVDMPDCLPPVGAGQIWLAYASACKFSNGNTGLLELTWFVSPEIRRDRYKTPAHWTVIPAPPYLPSEVDYYFDASSFRQYQAVGDAIQLGGKPLWTSYKASTFTNVGSLRLPSSFEFEAYNAESTNQKPETVYKYHGQLTRVFDSVTSDAFTHGFGTKTFVEDARFVSRANPAAFVRYATTTAIVPNTNDPQMIAAAALAKRTQFLGNLPPPGNNRVSTRSILILFGIGLTIFVLVILVLRQK